MLKSNLHCENKSVHYKLHWLLGETHRTNWEKQKTGYEFTDHTYSNKNINKLMLKRTSTFTGKVNLNNIVIYCGNVMKITYVEV